MPQRLPDTADVMHGAQRESGAESRALCALVGESKDIAHPQRALQCQPRGARLRELPQRASSSSAIGATGGAERDKGAAHTRNDLYSPLLSAGEPRPQPQL